MAIKNDREYRNFRIQERADGDPEYQVAGYAATFAPYVLGKIDGVEYLEQIERDAFDGADMSDVIFLYNHGGMVYARQKNGTLSLNLDDHGLRVSADLSSTEGARQMYETIRSGLIDQMSFAFRVREDAYDRETHTRKILKIDKVYDVSAVSIPANPDTDISAVSARSWIDGVIETEKAERLERERELALAKAVYNYHKEKE